MWDDGRRVSCITLDLEKDWNVSGEDSNPTFDHLDEYISMIQALDIPLSIFGVGVTIEQHPDVVRKLQKELDTEFHLHSYQHDMSKSYDFHEEIRRGIDVFHDYFGRNPTGYRAPQGNIEPGEWAKLEQAGFKFDASVFPSYRPGVYNNLRAPLTPYVPDEVDELVEIPFAAAPKLRIPISQNYLKLLGDPYIYTLKRGFLPDLIVYDSHLQDFWHTEFHSNLPNPKRTLMTRNIHRSVDIFENFMQFLKDEEYKFVKISDIYESYSRT